MGLLAKRAPYLGLGFVSASIASTYATSPLFSSVEGLPTSADGLWELAMAVGVAALCALALATWRCPLMRVERLLIPSACLCVLGLGGAFAADAAGISRVWLLVGQSANAVGISMMFVLWADVFRHLEIEAVEVLVPSSSAVMLVCLAARLAFPGALSAAGALLLPVASAACLLACYTMQKEGRPAGADGACPADVRDGETLPSEGARSRFDTCRLMVAVALIYVAVCWADAASTPSSMDALPVIGGAACGVALAVAFVTFSPRIDFDSLIRCLSPLIIVGLLLLVMGGSWQGAVTRTIDEIVDVVIQAGTYIIFIREARRGRASAVPCIALTLAAAQLGALVGNYGGVAATSGPLSQAWPCEVVAMAMATLVALAAALTPRPGLVRVPVPSCAVDAAQGRQPEGLDARDAQIDLRCDAVAEACGLSPRETDVLRLLARGRTQPYIRDALVLSKSTVSTHVAGIYRKCGVHSKQELIDLVEEASVGVCPAGSRRLG